jgi:ribokinase
VFGLADIVTPNRTELGQLLTAEARRIGRPTPGADRPDVGARTLLEPNSEGEGVRRAVLVTLGAAGAALVRRGRDVVDIAPPAGIGVVDTVGAGDALNGAFAAALAEGRSLEEAARRAVVGGSIATTRMGAREGMPTRAELEAALAR